MGRGNSQTGETIWFKPRNVPRREKSVPVAIVQPVVQAVTAKPAIDTVKSGSKRSGEALHVLEGPEVKDSFEKALARTVSSFIFLIPKVTDLDKNLLARIPRTKRIQVLCEINDLYYHDKLVSNCPNIVIREYKHDCICYIRDGNQEGGLGWASEKGTEMITTTNEDLIRAMNQIFLDFWPRSRVDPTGATSSPGTVFKPLEAPTTSSKLIAGQEVMDAINNVMLRTVSSSKLLLPVVTDLDRNLLARIPRTKRIQVLCEINDKSYLDELVSNHPNLDLRDYSHGIYGFIRDGNEEGGLGYRQKKTREMVITTNLELVSVINQIFLDFWPRAKKL